MKKYLKILLVILVVFLISGFLGYQAEAGKLGDAILLNLDSASGGLQGMDITKIIVLLIKGALQLLVLIFLIIIIIAGFRWMTAGGNEETVAKAKKHIAYVHPFVLFASEYLDTRCIPDNHHRVKSQGLYPSESDSST